jgi:hypothetical protein
MRGKGYGEGDPVTPKASLGSLWTTAYLKAFVGVRRVVASAAIVNTARALRLRCDMVKNKKGKLLMSLDSRQTR